MYNFDVIIKNANMFSIMIPQNATQPSHRCINFLATTRWKTAPKQDDGSRADKMATRPPRNVSFIIIIRRILRECSLLIECLPAEKDLFSNDHYKISCNSPPPLVLHASSAFRSASGLPVWDLRERTRLFLGFLGPAEGRGGFEGGLKTREKGPPRTPNIGENKTISGKMIARGSQALETGRATRAEPRAIRRTPRACYFLLGPFFFFCAAFWLDPTWNFGLKWLVEFVCNFTREPLKSRWWTEIYSEYESIYSLL